MLDEALGMLTFINCISHGISWRYSNFGIKKNIMRFSNNYFGKSWTLMSWLVNPAITPLWGSYGMDCDTLQCGVLYT